MRDKELPEQEEEQTFPTVEEWNVPDEYQTPEEKAQATKNTLKQVAFGAGAIVVCIWLGTQGTLPEETLRDAILRAFIMGGVALAAVWWTVKNWKKVNKQISALAKSE